MPDYVIQAHRHREIPLHWDLMLDQGDRLRTFRLDRPPQDLARHPAGVTPIADHDRRFLTYEGPVQQGRGHVRIVDRGTYEIRACQGGHWQIRFAGHHLTGDFVLNEGGTGEAGTLQRYPTGATNGWPPGPSAGATGRSD